MRIGKEMLPQMGRNAGELAGDIRSARVTAVVSQAGTVITAIEIPATTSLRTSRSSAICVTAANIVAPVNQSPLAHRGRAGHGNHRGGA